MNEVFDYIFVVVLTLLSLKSGWDVGNWLQLRGDKKERENWQPGDDPKNIPDFVKDYSICAPPTVHSWMEK